MTKDLNKNILSITYNSLNLPQKVLFRDKQYSKYVYNSDGEKMKAIYFTPFPREVVNPVPDDTVIARPPIHGGRVNAKRRVEIFPSTPSPEMGTHDSIVYCGNFIYSNQSLEQVLFDGGYMTLDSLGLPHYHFYQHDHLGSVRAVVDENGKTEHFDEYYPFGATNVQESAPNNRRYKYNGKELDRMHGLNLLDYGAHWYDPLLGRFTTMDPLCEKYYSISPYAYCANNPVIYIDPDGKKVYLYATTLPTSNKLMKLGGLPTHTFITVENSSGKIVRYAAYGPEKSNPFLSFNRLSECHYQQDIDIYKGKDKVNCKAKIEVPIPEGMTSEEFDNSVVNTINSYGNENGIRYDILPTNDIQGNCNSSSSTILLKSGVSEEIIEEIREKIPGVKTGFDSKAKPWTSDEQKKAIKDYYEEMCKKTSM